MKLLVGPEPLVVALNRDLLCHNSSYIQGLVDNNSAPSSPGEIQLREVETSTFEVFSYWILHHKLSCKIENDEWCLPLTKAWVFAKRIGTPGLANNIIEYIGVVVKNNPDVVCPSIAAAQYL